MARFSQNGIWGAASGLRFSGPETGPRKYLVLVTFGAVDSCVQLGVTRVPHRAPEGVADTLREGMKCSESVVRAGRLSSCTEGEQAAPGHIPLPIGSGQEKEVASLARRMNWAALSKENVAIFRTGPNLGGGRFLSPAAV